MTLGIYIHIPFCQAKCTYCHFVSMPFRSRTADRYGEAVLKEMEAFVRAHPEDEEVNSVYFGGGTPSLVPAGQITDLLARSRRLLHISDDCEVSLEANPGTIPADKVDAYRRSGVNRISLGAQSFTDSELSSVGRLHTSEMIFESLSVLRDGGFANINLDLMLGLPGQTAETWRRNLQAVGRAEVPHLSVYMLDLDDECPLQAMAASGSVRMPDEDLISDLYLETVNFLSGCGYSQYEISNFARPGYASRHNLKYWQRERVRGLGLASHSFDGHARYSNYSQMAEYFDAMDAGRSPVCRREQLTAAQSLSESLFLGLRLTRGVDWSRLQAVYGSECLNRYESGMRDLAHRGLIEWEDSVVRLTAPGMLLSNEVFQLFI